MTFASRLSYLISFAPIYLFLKLARLVPFRRRVALGGALASIALRRFPPARARVMSNLARIRPDMSETEALSLCSEIGRQLGRTLTEILFGEEHQSRHLAFRVSGPGLAAIEAAHAEGKPILLVSAHFGQWDAARIHLRDALGVEVGALYRPNNNPYYEPYLAAGAAASGTPLVPKGNDGFRMLLRHLKGGGAFAIMADQYHSGGEVLPFLGADAKTALTPAELAIRYKAPLVPCFGIRRDAEEAIDVVFEAPIPVASPEEMMTEFNNRATARIEADPDQWLWPHRRWKGLETRG
ncbi:lysophospholipid acyltransferase family protein [Dinoroseobacter sp. S124A]|uniref:lysophospholipid acyltransferase family protein n=1 Tax=Dinoroseobacter sp. S124A TaxID=3415128 RepID=UPI003C79F187